MTTQTDADSLSTLMTDPLALRAFWTRIEKKGEHLVWSGSLERGSYPVLYFQDMALPARRVYRIVMRLPVDDTSTLRHTCEEPGCVVHCDYNVCASNHKLTEDNIVPYYTRERRCLTCHRAQSRAAVARTRARKREAADAALVAEYVSKPLAVQDARKLAEAILRTAGA